MEPEELTELLDDDLEMWAQGGTRILPKSQLEARPQTQSYPPVAYAPLPSFPPRAPAPSHAPWLAAAVGMAAVFFLAAVGGGIFYAMHLASASATESLASTNTTTPTVITASEPEHVTLTTTAEPIVVTATTATAPQKIPAITAPVPVVRYGTIQTFAVGTGKPVFVDGKQIGIGGSHLKTACGKHAVSVGTGKARTYDIPCSGTAITVGTPD